MSWLGVSLDDNLNVAAILLNSCMGEVVLVLFLKEFDCVSHYRGVCL